MKTNLLFLFLFLFAAKGMGQRYSFRNYTTHDGLVQTEITDIKQDKQGNIWIGTNGGLSIFDGKKFTNYDDHDLLGNLRINSLFCDTSGTMWVGTGNGLLRFSNGFRSFFKQNNTPQNQTQSLTANAHGELFFVCNTTLYKISASSKAEPFCISRTVDNKVAFAAFDRADNLWVTTTDFGVYKKAGDLLSKMRTPFSANRHQYGEAFLRILGKETATPYFVTTFGAFGVAGDSLLPLVKQHPHFGKAGVGFATYVLQNNDSSVWVGAARGLAKLSPNTAQPYTKENGFCDNSVSCLFTDRENNLWIGCTYNGLYKLSNEALFQLTPSDASIDLRHVSAMLPLQDDSRLIGTWGRGLFLWKRNVISPVHLPWTPLYITSLTAIGEYTYIGSLHPGLFRINNKTYRVETVSAFATETVYRIFKIGEKLLVQTLGDTCFLTDDQLNIQGKARLPDEYLLTVVDNNIYRLGPFGNVDLLDKNNLQVQRKNIFSGISSRITQMVRYKENFFIGTFGQGLFLYNKKGELRKRLDKKNGLPTNLVTGLLVNNNQLFIGSNLGLLSADLPALQTVKTYTENKGLFNWECRREGLQKLPDGSLFISTTNGPYLYYPQKDSSDAYASGVLSLAAFRYGKEGTKGFTVNATAQKNSFLQPIAYGDNAVAIVLNGVSQRDPEGLLYHYQLTGDSGWTATADPVVKFSGLLPGDYLFKAYISTGNFVSKPLTIQFLIARPLSGTLWFQAVLILFLSVVSWLLLTVGNRVYQRYIHARTLSKIEAANKARLELTTQSLFLARQNFTALQTVFKSTCKEPKFAAFTEAYFGEASKRIELLWSRETMPLDAFHQYFDELVQSRLANAKLYHKLAAADTEIDVHLLLPVLRIFSLYLFAGLFENGVGVFSLDSEYKTNGQVLLRFYTVSREAASNPLFTHDFLKQAIQEQQHKCLTVEVIENLEYGNTLLAELTIKTPNS